MKPELGELQAVELRNIWPEEAADFTPWLAAHLPALSDVLGLDLELTAREAAVGDFSLDLLARDIGTNKKVIIENQFGRTNHDHLGKLITYAAGYDAQIVIWLAEELREEHRQGLDWLNQRTDENTEFFGVVVELWKIDDSRPACNFKLVAFPNDWAKTKHALPVATPRGEAYRAFFQQLIDELREKHHFTGARLGQAQCWYSFSSGTGGIQYSTSFAQNGQVRAELYLGRRDQNENKRIFDEFLRAKVQIESEFGEPLKWERLEGRQASRIAIYRPGSIDCEPAALDEIRAWAIARLLKLKDVFGPKLAQVGNSLSTA
ncbi:MAG: DUF4268 domain-containing protein [Tepidisphaeraceae bacterium]